MSGGLVVVRGDITRFVGGAIVRCIPVGLPSHPASDPILLAGGAGLWVEIQRHEPLDEARPVVTPPFGLPAGAVIHVAAPVWRGGGQDEDRRLALTVERVLVAAVRNQVTHVAFSPIGPGFPLDAAAAIAVGTIHSALFATPSIEDVVFVCPTNAAWQVHDDAVSAWLD